MELITANLYNRARENVSWLPTNNYDADQIEYVALVDYVYVIPHYDIKLPTQLFHVERYIYPSSKIRKHDSALRDIVLGSTKKESDAVCNF